MKIRQLLLILAGISMPLISMASAADVAFVYLTDEAIRSGRPVFGSVVAEGVIAPADAVLSAGGDVFVGLPDGAVKKASLVRLDKDLNVALLRLGDRLINPELQSAHRKRALQLQSLIPSQPVPLEAETPSMENGTTLVSNGTPVFKISVDGAPITKNVVHYKSRLNKAKFSVELVSVSSETLRAYTFRIRSNPRLGFLNRDRTLSKDTSPRYDYTYVSSNAVKPGKQIKFPLEAHFINAKDYEWVFEVESAGHLQQEKLFVHFD